MSSDIRIGPGPTDYGNYCPECGTRGLNTGAKHLSFCSKAPLPYTVYEPVVIVGDRSLLTIDEEARIDSFVKLEIGLEMHIGRNVHIASFAHIGIGGGKTYLGDYSAVSSGGKIISGSNMPDGKSMSASAPKILQRVDRRITRIAAYAFLGTNAIVMPGVTLNEGAVLAAGAVATKDIPEWEVWAGVPAKFLCRRVLKP